MARRRRYNPNQKRDRAGRWTKGARGAALSTGAATPAGGGTYKTAKQRRYEGYQKHLAQQAEIQAANRKKNQRRAIAASAAGAFAVGAIAASGYRRRGRPTATVTPLRTEESVRPGRPASRSGSPLKMHNENLARETPSTRVNLVRDMPKAKPQKVSAGPNPAASKMAGSKVSTAPKVSAKSSGGVQNPTALKTVPPDVAKVQRGGRKSTDTPARSDEVLILKANSKERQDINRRRQEDIRKMNDVLKQKGLVINDLSGRRVTEATATKREAAREREAAKLAAKRKANYSDTWRTEARARLLKKQEAKKLASRRARAEARYADILQNAQLQGKKLNRTQRRYLADLGL